MHRPALTGREIVGQLAGEYDGLKITCEGCPKVTCLPFKLLSRRHGLRATEPVGLLALRLKCRSCGARVQVATSIKPWRVGDGQPRGV